MKAWAQLRQTGPAFLVVGDSQSLASASGSGATIVRSVISPDEAAKVFPDAIPVLDIPLRAPVVSGQPTSDLSVWTKNLHR